MNLRNRIVRSLIVCCLLATVLTPQYTVFAGVDAGAVTREVKEVVDIINKLYLNNQDLDQDALVEGAIKGMMDTLDEYTDYFNEEEYVSFLESMSDNLVGIGIYYNLLDDGSVFISEVIKGSPAEASGLKDFDLIVAVNGTSLIGLAEYETTKLMTGEAGSKVKLGVLRQDTNLSFDVTRSAFHVPSVIVRDMNEMLDTVEDPLVRYIQITGFNDKTGDDFLDIYFQCLKDGVEGIIIDVRDNPGGYLQTCFEITSRLVPTGTIVRTVDARGKQTIIEGGIKTVPFKTVILTNRNSASASELMAAAVQDAKSGIIMGERTFGKGVIQQLVDLKSGAGLKITTEEYLSRNGNKIHEIGVKPDIELSLPYYILVESGINENSASEDIRELRKLLKYIGHDAIDDTLVSYGSDVKSIIEQIQRDNGMAVDGVCDVRVQRLLNIKLRDSFAERDTLLESAYDKIKTML